MKDMKWPILKTLFRNRKMPGEGIRMQQNFNAVCIHATIGEG